MINYANKFYTQRSRPWWAFWRQDEWSVYSIGTLAECLQDLHIDCPVLRAVTFGKDAKQNAQQLVINFQALWEQRDVLTILRASRSEFWKAWEESGAAAIDRKIQGGNNWPKIIDRVQADCEADERKTNPSV